MHQNWKENLFSLALQRRIFHRIILLPSWLIRTNPYYSDRASAAAIAVHSPFFAPGPQALHSHE
jgi:hypothetical protein